MSVAGQPTDSHTVHQRGELRLHIAKVLEPHADAIAGDALTVLPYAGLEPSGDFWPRLASVAIQGLLSTAREGGVDVRSTEVTDLVLLARERRVPVAQLFELVYLLERAALDELALDDAFGANSEAWPAITHIVHRASFDVLAAFADRVGQEAGDQALIDPLTTLHTRAVLHAALDKELLRTERFRHPFALIVFDLDHLAGINAKHGYGFGDRVLERIGIVIRNYFREQDWVARASGSSFAVLLPETNAEHAEQLAQRVRETVQGRLSLLRDHLSEEPVLVTVSVACVIVQSADGSVRGEDLLREASQAIRRAKDDGRHGVERVDVIAKAGAPHIRDTQALS